MAPWLIHRVTGLLLIVLVALKICSGYGLANKTALPAYVAELHKSAWVEVPLLFCLCFHVAYGLRLMLIDLGVVWDRFLFWLFTILALCAFGVLYWAFYILQ